MFILLIYFWIDTCVKNKLVKREVRLFYEEKKDIIITEFLWYPKQNFCHTTAQSQATYIYELYCISKNWLVALTAIKMNDQYM